MITSLFVSHHGDDRNDCTNRSMPCRTVRHAVKISTDEDQIHIDYARGKPYMECENVTLSKCSILLTKSVSFHGINGKAEIRCRKGCNFFTIASQGYNITRIKFMNLVILHSNTLAKLKDGTKSELVFENMLISDSNFAIYSKNSTLCSIMIFNSSFENNLNFQWGIYLRCRNLIAHITSSAFKITPIFVENIGNIPTRWTKNEIFVRNTTFDNENVRTGAQMFSIKPFVAILNITIIDSEFRNHAVFSSIKHGIGTSALQVYDYYSNVRNITFMLFSNVVFKNNYNNWAALSLNIGYQKNTKVVVMIRESIFRNNSIALRVSSRCFCSYFPGIRKVPTIILEKNTFVQNFIETLRTNGAAAIFFKYVKSRVSSCRFLDNKPGRNPYTGVVTISERAKVTFFSCYFENRQITEQANQLFISGGQSIHFYGENTFNLVALKESQTVFVRTLTNVNAAEVITKKNFKILCPQGYKLNAQRQCKILKTQYRCRFIIAKCELCPQKTYTIERGGFIFNESNDIKCQQCPRGGECDNGLVNAKPNFWGHKTKMTKIVFFQCLPGYCCQSKDCLTFDSCYGNRSGTLCGQCPEGMSESLFSTQCISNKQCSLNYFFVLGGITVLVLYLIFFLYHKEIVGFIRRRLISKCLSFRMYNRRQQRNNAGTGGNNSSASGMIKIFFYYYQVCNLVRSSVGSSKSGHLIPYFENVISGVMNMILVNLPSLNCPLKDLRAVPKAVIVHSVGHCLLGLLCLLYLTSTLFLIFRRLRTDSDRETGLEAMVRNSIPRNHDSKPSFSQRLASAFSHISLLMYASSAKLCLSLLHCVPVGDSEVLFLDGNIKCYQTFQYFLLVYLVSSILPFCLVPILGPYLLKSSRIGVKQFYAACILPLPFCCFWLYLLLKDCHPENQGMNNSTIEENVNAVSSEQDRNDTQDRDSEEISDGIDENETILKTSESAILGVLLGPFRRHKGFTCFPSSQIPWEGFLIFRRLVLIIVLTFVQDIQLRLFLTLILCAAILIFHMFVNPYQRKRDNVLECFSLGAHVILCGSTLIKALYYGEDYSPFSSSLSLLNVIENILIIAPLSIVMIIIVLSIIIKLVFGVKLCLSVLIRKIGRSLRFIM